MSYIIGPMSMVKGEGMWPEFANVLKDIETKSIRRASEIWEGYTFGGLTPNDRQFGICPLRAGEMASDVSTTTLSGTYSFRKNLADTGWHPIFNYSTRKDILHAFAGFAVTDEILRIIQFRMEISDRKFPIFDLQEAQSWGNFAILIKQDIGEALIAEPETSVLIEAYVEATGYQRIVPLGFQLYKRKDLVISKR